LLGKIRKTNNYVFVDCTAYENDANKIKSYGSLWLALQ
jgi:hypothetical protein